MSQENALFGTDGGLLSEQEREISDYIKTLAENAPLTPMQKVVASMCRALAKSIAEGNRKGRSVANDVERLMATMAELAGTTNAAADLDGFTDAERDLIDALALPPRHDPAQTGYTA